jgi:hypothetical protein
VPGAHVGPAHLRGGDGAGDVPRRLDRLRQARGASSEPRGHRAQSSVLLEVTSDSSEEYDTGEKLASYLTIPSLKEYVVVSHRERRITVHQRGSEGAWTERVAIAGGQVAVPSVGATLVVDRIYRGSAIERARA